MIVILCSILYTVQTSGIVYPSAYRLLSSVSDPLWIPDWLHSTMLDKRAEIESNIESAILSIYEQRPSLSMMPFRDIETLVHRWWPYVILPYLKNPDSSCLWKVHRHDARRGYQMDGTAKNEFLMDLVAFDAMEKEPFENITVDRKIRAILVMIRNPWATIDEIVAFMFGSPRTRLYLESLVEKMTLPGWVFRRLIHDQTVDDIVGIPKHTIDVWKRFGMGQPGTEQSDLIRVSPDGFSIELHGPARTAYLNAELERIGR